MKHNVTIGLNSAEFDDTNWDKDKTDYFISLGLQSLMHSRFQATKRGKKLTKSEESSNFKACAEKIKTSKVRVSTQLIDK